MEGASLKIRMPGARRGETREDGQRRRDREAKVRMADVVKKIRAEESVRLSRAKALIEATLGNYDDRPLGR
jgi:hypothetical protein